ncbi:transposase [Jiangella endophytica]|uniref:transposase n=1 Tax=Jiangella endophytica TaxID=1623398 RepID=UPI0018E58C09|nr:transposase [Jiangella endophytica]
MLASVRPRDVVGKTRRRIAADELANLMAIEKKVRALTVEIKAIVKERGSNLMGLSGVGPVVTARILADVGDVARFADRNRFASWTGTAPLDASSGEQTRHRLSRAGNRRINRMLHIAATTQMRLDTEGRAYYRRKLAAGKTRMEACAASHDGSPTRSTGSWSPMLAPPTTSRSLERAREGTAGRLINPARSTCPRTSTLRISHSPGPRNRRYNRAHAPGSPRPRIPQTSRLTTEGSRNDVTIGDQRSGRMAAAAR